MESAKNPEIVFYVGTRKLVALAGVMRDGEPHVIGQAIRVNPEGFKNGLVTNLERASHSLESLLHILFSVSGRSANPLPSEEIEATVVLGNPKLKTMTFSSAQYFQGVQRIISSHDVRSVVDQTRNVAMLPLSESVLQAVPVSFLVNDLQDVSNPIGLEAKRLGVCLKIFTMDFQDFRNVAKAFEAADIDVKGYYPKMLTASEAVLSEEEKEEGALLTDIAGGTATLILWKNGELVDTLVLDLGGRYLSSQLANLWEIDLQDAEKVKELYGSLEKNPQFQEELIPMVDRNGKKAPTVSRRIFQEKFLELAKSWMEQILSRADAFSHDAKVFHPHCVFTGGGTCMDGFLEFLHREFSRDSRLGLTRRVDAANELLVDPSLTGALGMFAWMAYGASEKARLLAPQSLFQKTFFVARDWFSSYF
jgi:cell division protein FtsA